MNTPDEQLKQIEQLTFERDATLDFTLGLQLKISTKDEEIRHLKHLVESGQNYVLLMEKELVNHRIHINQLEKYQTELQTELKKRLNYIEELQRYVHRLEAIIRQD